MTGPPSSPCHGAMALTSNSSLQLKTTQKRASAWPNRAPLGAELWKHLIRCSCVVIDICVNICIYIYMCVCLYIHVVIYVYIYLYMYCANIYIYIDIDIDIYIDIHTYV